MNKRILKIMILFLCLTALFACKEQVEEEKGDEGITYSGTTNYAPFCVHTGYGNLTLGPLNYTSLLYYIQYLYSKTQSNGPYSQLFMVQNSGGYYVKVCNDDDSKTQFKNQYLTGGGTWSCSKTCATTSIIATSYYSTEGIFSFSVSDNSKCVSDENYWNVCQYSATSLVGQRTVNNKIRASNNDDLEQCF